ncbi:MAG: Smr/MutS family protein [Alphaproteobacteria bacterium]|nr:Smr/MutS family protein [Alphaproteobacteria bacterium]
MTGARKKPPTRTATQNAGGPATDYDDASLWRQVAESTKPLPGKSVRSPEPPATPKPPPPRAAPAPTVQNTAQRQVVPALPELEPGRAAGLDRRTAERLRRGQLPIDGRLDLHGWTQDEAHRALSGFIESAHAAGQRCLLVITGKGRVRADDPYGRNAAVPGVLRTAVPNWLNQPSLRPMILGFAGAQPKHGGGGALYVLLRRKR